jgi:hypothetical protein
MFRNTDKQKTKSHTFKPKETHTASTQSKKKHTPFPTYEQKHIYILIKKYVHIPDQEEPGKKYTVEEVNLHTTTTFRQSIGKHFMYV